MRRGIAVFVSMVSLLWQVGAHAAIDWDAKLRAELQPQHASIAAGIAALSTETTVQPIRHLSPLLAAARVHWSELSEETRALVRPWMLRPTSSGPSYEKPAWVYPPTATVSVRVTAHFRIHFLDKQTYPNGANAATQLFVKSVADVLEEVWAKENSLGYAAVPPDTAALDNGGGDAYDVYLTNLGPDGYYGYVQPEDYSNELGRPHGAYSYMVLDNDYTDPIFNSAADPVLPIKVTVAHEYFHAIQLGYSLGEDAAFAEQTATWMEDVVYPDIHDNYQYLGEVYTDIDGNGRYTAGEPYADRNGNGRRDVGSSNYPEAPLDAFDEPKRVQYGRFVWIHYLTQNYGEAVIRSIWEQFSKSPGDSYAAINAVLQAKGKTLARVYQDYATWGYDKSLFTNGSNYPLVLVDRSQSGSSAAFSSQESPALKSLSSTTPQLHLSTVYSQIVNPSGGYSFSSSGGGTAELTVLVDYGSGSLQHQIVTLSGGSGTWVTPSGAVKAILVISNVSAFNNGMSWNFSSGIAPATKKSGKGEIDAWFVLLLAMSSAFCYRRRIQVLQAPSSTQAL